MILNFWRILSRTVPRVFKVKIVATSVQCWRDVRKNKSLKVSFGLAIGKWPYWKQLMGLGREVNRMQWIVTWIRGGNVETMLWRVCDRKPWREMDLAMAKGEFIQLLSSPFSLTDPPSTWSWAQASGSYVCRWLTPWLQLLDSAGVCHPSWASASPKAFSIWVKSKNPFPPAGWLLLGAEPGEGEEMSFMCAEQSRCVERSRESIPASQAMFLKPSQGTWIVRHWFWVKSSYLIINPPHSTYFALLK